MNREFSGKDVNVVMLGRPTAVNRVKYGAKQNKKNHFVLGSVKPYAKIVGRKDYTGEIALPQSEFEALVRTLPAGTDPLDIKAFDIVVTYLDEATGFAVTDILKDCEFTEYNKEMSNDDEMMEVVLPLNIGEVLPNVK